MNTELLIKIVERSDKDFALAMVPSETLKKYTQEIIRECVICLYRRGVQGFGILEERMLNEHFGVKS